MVLIDHDGGRVPTQIVKNRAFRICLQHRRWPVDDKNVKNRDASNTDGGPWTAQLVKHSAFPNPPLTQTVARGRHKLLSIMLFSPDTPLTQTVVRGRHKLLSILLFQIHL